MNSILFARLNTGRTQRVFEDSVSENDLEMAKASLQPVLNGEQGSIRGAFKVSGEITQKKATLEITDEGVPLGVLGVCLHSRSSPPTWTWLQQHAVAPLANMDRPRAPWAALRKDVHQSEFPDFLEHWAKAAALYLNLKGTNTENN